MSIDQALRSNMRTSVGPEPCLQCSEHMRSYCGTKAIKCKAFAYYEKTGITAVRSLAGWRDPWQSRQ